MKRRILLKVFFRSLLFQATWNFERMQNLGVAFALAPALDALYPEARDRAEAYKRHLELFNTHPYLASIVLGVSVRLEEEQSTKGVNTSELIHSFKVGTMGGLGALGDAFFWASFKPLSVVVGLLWAALVDEVSALVVFLVLYNLVHVSSRAAGFYLGYTSGVDAAVRLQKLNLPKVGKWVKMATLGLLGWYAALAASGVSIGGQAGIRPPWVASLLLISYGAWRCLQAGMSTTVLIYVVTALTVLLTYLIL